MKSAFLPFLLILSLPPAFAQSNDTIRQVDGLMSRWNNATPGGSIAIVRNDKMVYNKAFGLADLEYRVPNTTETIFECGSVSKQFTAFSILLLASEGKLALTDDVRKYIPELPIYEKPITLQHLVNHTSGLKDWGSIGELAGWPRTTRVYTQDLALEIICRQKSLNFTPGSEYSYSNSNYTLLVTVVERVSKQSLAEFTRVRLFEPLGMTHTQWRDNFREVVPGRAIAYSGSGEVYTQNMPFENIYGHGGLLTTTGDLLKWNKVLETHQPGGDALAAMRVQKGRLAGGKEISYAAGLFVGSFNGFDEIQHSGATAGYRAWLAYYPQKKLSIAILSNDATFSPDGVGKEIAGLFLGKTEPKNDNPATISLTESEIKKWPGIYKSIRTFDVFTVELKDNKVYSNGQALKALHRDTLYLGGLKWVSLQPGTILLQNPADTMRYKRMNPPDLNPSSLQELRGEYYSEEAETRFFIEVKGQEVWVHRRPSTSFKLTPAFLDGYFTDSRELYEFRRNKNRKIIGLEISMSRAERIPFSKTQKNNE